MTAKQVETSPPGLFIKLELDERGWSQRDLAFILGMTEQQLNPLLSGKRAISADMARLLGDAFNVDAQLFANLQSQYDISRAKEPDPGVRTRATLQNKYPVRDMIRRGWIEETEGSLLDLQVKSFFELSNDNEDYPVKFAAKRTHYDQTPPNQLAWVFRVRQIARTQKVPIYSRSNLTELLPKLRALMIHAEAVTEALELLLKVGVRVVIVEALPGSKIDGVCTWLSADEPVIGLSTLHDRLDNFSLVLRHEIEHVLRQDGLGGIGMIDTLTGSDEPSDDCEKVANMAAADFCIPVDKMNSFYARKHPYFSERDVLGFAATMGVHPAIVVGQLQKKMGRYDYLRKYQVQIRKHLISEFAADGWGNVIEARS